MLSVYLSTTLAVLTLVVHIGIVLFFFLFAFKSHMINKFVSYVAHHTLLLSFIVSLAGLVGSFIYSEVIGYAPCVLCWVQRVFLYPQVVLFAIAQYKKDFKVFMYTLPLSLLGGIVALYHAFTQLGGFSITPCTAAGGACSKVFVSEFGYITIPMMAFTAFLVLIVLVVIRRIYEKQV